MAARNAPADTVLRVAGIVSNADTAGHTFDIRRLRVDYSQAQLVGPDGRVLRTYAKPDPETHPAEALRDLG